MKLSHIDKDRETDDIARLKRAMLAILRQEPHTERQLWVAMFLGQLDPTLPRRAAEYRALVPTIAEGLNAQNEADTPPRWPALGSAMLLSAMGPGMAEEWIPAIGARFNAPVASRIEGESYECWTRYWLGGALTRFGKAGIEPLVRGLSHGDPWVRECSLNGLARLAGDEPLDPGVKSAGPESAERRAARAAVIEAVKVPAVQQRIVALLKDADNRDAAASAAKALGIAVN